MCPSPPSLVLLSRCHGLWDILWPVRISCPGPPGSCRGDVAEAALVLCQPCSHPWALLSTSLGTSTAQHVGLGENQLQLLQSQGRSLSLRPGAESGLGVCSQRGNEHSRQDVAACPSLMFEISFPLGRMLLNDSKKGPPHLHYRRPYGCAVLSIMDVLQSISEIKEEKDFVLKVYT